MLHKEELLKRVARELISNFSFLHKGHLETIVTMGSHGFSYGKNTLFEHLNGQLTRKDQLLHRYTNRSSKPRT